MHKFSRVPCHVHVDQGYLRLLVSQEVLQIRRGIALYRFIRGAGMAKRVTAKLFADPGKLPVLLNNIHDAAHGKMGALVVEKHVLVKASWPVGKLSSYGLGGFLFKVDRSLLVALAVNQHR